MKYLVFVLVLISASVVADPTWHTSKVTKVYPLSTGNVVVMFKDDNPNCTSASNPKYYYIAPGENGVNEMGLKNMYSALLTAAATGKDVTINFDSASSSCHINRLLVNFQ